MPSLPPLYPDNPDHANGTCEACGNPCAVYGCRWCPDCYGLAEVQALRLRRDPELLLAGMVAQRAFRRLSAAEQFDHWLQVNGQVRPTDDVRDCYTLRALVAAGQDWVALAERTPHEDPNGRLQYMVFAPAYGGWLFRCRPRGEQWACADGLLIGGVSHWRLARDDESARQALAAELPAVTRNDTL